MARAVIAFTNKEQVSEDWNWFYGDILDACTKQGIPVHDVGPEDVNVVVLEDVIVDLSPYLAEHSMGYLFVRGSELKYEPYNQPYVVLAHASEFFGIS